MSWCLPCSTLLLDLADSMSSGSSGYHWEMPEAMSSPILSMRRLTVGDTSFISADFSTSTSSSPSVSGSKSSRARTARCWKQEVGEALLKQCRTASHGGSTANTWGDVVATVAPRTCEQLRAASAVTVTVSTRGDMIAHSRHTDYAAPPGYHTLISPALWRGAECSTLLHLLPSLLPSFLLLLPSFLSLLFIIFHQHTFN